jgi:hypothetical protein
MEIFNLNRPMKMLFYMLLCCLVSPVPVKSFQQRNYDVIDPSASREGKKDLLHPSILAMSANEGNKCFEPLNECKYNLPDTLMNEDFHDNWNDWSLEDSRNAYINVKNDKYIFKNLSAKRLYVSRNFSVDSSADFSFQVKLTRTKGFYKTDYFGICYGIKDGSHMHAFLIREKGQFSVLRYNEKYKPLVLDLESEYININDDEPNILRVTREKDKIYFYINNQQVQVLRSENLFGDGFGVISDGLMNLEIDDFLLIRNNTSDQ